MTIGVLAFQGSCNEHIYALKKHGQLDNIIPLIIPGGESTTMAKLAEYHNLVYGNENKGQKVMCVELIGNCFLRWMVRVLVATTIRQDAAGVDDETLLNLMEATYRCATTPPAPPDGLCLLDVGYEDFDPENTLIQ